MTQRAVEGIPRENVGVQGRGDRETGMASWMWDLMDYWISQGEGEPHRFPLDCSISHRKYQSMVNKITKSHNIPIYIKHVGSTILF